MRVSVVVCMTAPPAPKALEGLAYQSHSDMEIIVVHCPGAEDLGSLPENVRIRTCPRSHEPTARNVGIEVATGTVVAFLDVNSIPDPRWLQELMFGYDQSFVGGVGGPLATSDGRGRTYTGPLRDRQGWLRANERPPLTAYQFPGSDPYVELPASNCSFRRACLEQVSGYDETQPLGDAQSDLCRRMIDEGYWLRHRQRAVVYPQLKQPGPASNKVTLPDSTSRLTRRTIGILTPDYPPNSQDEEAILSRELARSFAREGHEVHVITPTVNRPRVEFQAGVWVHSVSTDEEAYLNVCQLHVDRRLDLLYTLMGRGYGLPCLLDSVLPTIPVLTYLPGIGEWAKDEGSRGEAECLDQADRIVVPTSALVQQAKRMGLDYARRIRVFRIGVTDRAVGLGHQENHPPRVLLLGTPDWLSELTVRFPGVEWITPSLGDQPEWDRNLGAADIICLLDCSRFTGLRVIEAMMFGKPVIASLHGGIPEIVREGTNGMLVYPGQLPSFIKALTRLLEDGELRQRFGKASRKLYEAHFQAHHLAEALLAESPCDPYATAA